MPASDPIQILTEQNRWANRRMIDACEPLTSQQFHHKFEIGCGSLHDNLVHIVGAMKGWCALLLGQQEFERPEGKTMSVEDIRKAHSVVAQELIDVATLHPLEEILSGERAGRSYQFTRGSILVHVTTHGMHHRAQCLNMLRHLGVTPLPQSSVMEWTFDSN